MSFFVIKAWEIVYDKQVLLEQVDSWNDSSAPSWVIYCGLDTVLWALGVEFYLIIPALLLPFKDE